jgi:hypothetical protein
MVAWLVTGVSYLGALPERRFRQVFERTEV